MQSKNPKLKKEPSNQQTNAPKQFFEGKSGNANSFFPPKDGGGADSRSTFFGASPAIQQKKENGGGNPSRSMPANATKKPKIGDGSMLHLSNVVAPSGGKPGKADLTITMEYKTVTDGKGKVDKTNHIDVNGFKKIYSQGDQMIEMTQLPSAGSPCQTLADAKKANPAFAGTYYEVNVKYDFKVTKAPGQSLWDVMKWEMEEQQNRGGFFTPFDIAGAGDLKEFTKKKKKHVKKKRKALKKLDKVNPKDKRKSKDDLMKEAEGWYKLESEKKQSVVTTNRLRYLFGNMINDDKSGFQNKNIVVGKAFHKKLSKDKATTDLLKTLKSTLHADSTAVTPAKKVDIEKELMAFYIRYQKIYNFGRTKKERFEGKEDDSTAVGAAGILGDPNYVALSQKLYGTGAPSTFSFGKMTSAELLAHEAGHNAAAAFKHHPKGKGDYEYKQTGLQSNKHKHVKPTLANTLGIINDPNNRKHMTK